MFPFILFVSLVATYAMSQDSVPERTGSELSTTKQTLCLLKHEQDKTKQELTILIQEMAGNLNDVERRNAQLDNRVEQLSGRIEEMKFRNEQLGARDEQLSGSLDDMKRRNEQLGARVELLSGNLDDMERRNEQLAARVEQLSGRVQNVPHVGFSAYIADGAVYPASGETIPFSNTHINQGGHYNTRTSKYRCPVSGTYFFIFSFLLGLLNYGSDYYRSAAILVQDGNRVADAYCYTENPDDRIEFQCGSSVLTYCAEGSTMWLKSGHSANKMYGDSGRQSTFSGFLLYPD